MREIVRFNVLGESAAGGVGEVEVILVVECGPEDGSGAPFQVERRPVGRNGEVGPATWARGWGNALEAMACALDLAGWAPDVLAAVRAAARVERAG